MGRDTGFGMIWKIKINGMNLRVKQMKNIQQNHEINAWNSECKINIQLLLFYYIGILANFELYRQSVEFWRKKTHGRRDQVLMHYKR